MAPLAGYSAVLQLLGASTAMVAEPCANIDGGAYLKYQVTNTARRAIELGSAIVVKKNGVAVSTALYKLNPLFGIITFDSALIITDTVTIDAEYLGVLPVAEVHELNIALSATMLDKTSFDSGGVRERLAGLKDASGSWGQWAVLNDLIVGAGGAAYNDLLSGSYLMLEVILGARSFRCLITAEGAEQKASLDALVAASFNWQSTRRPDIQTAGLRVDHHFAFDNWT